MAKVIQAFQDNKGRLFPELEDATISDLSQLFGRQGSEEQAGMTVGICRVLLERRDDIRTILDAHDALNKQKAIKEIVGEAPFRPSKATPI